MKDIFLYVKKNFEKPENGLNQIILTHVLVSLAILCVKIGLLFITRAENVDTFLMKYFYLSSSWEDLFYRPWTLISYFFMSKSIFSLFINLSIFHLFARIIVSLLGSRRLLVLYFLGGICGGFSFLLVYTFAPLLSQAEPMTIHLPAAIYAVIIGAATFSPNLLCHRLLIPLPIKYIAFFLLLQPLVQLAQGEVAAVAQLGSALSGYLYMHYLKYMTRHPNFKQKFTKIFTSSVKTKNTAPDQSSGDTRNDSSHVPENIQVIFDKIASEGYDSLSDEEKKELFDAGLHR